MKAEDRFTSRLIQWHLQTVTALRTLRRTLGLTQAGLAALLEVPLNSFRMWDSGLRPVPAVILDRTQTRVARHAHEAEPLPLRRLADELGVHVQTLQRAVRTGRLVASFSTRSVFGQPRRLATRAAAAQFMADHYHRRLAIGQTCTAPLPSVPIDYDHRLRSLRRRLQLSQAALAARVGAAGKAVVYQWESRKRTPSPVFWQRVQELADARVERHEIPQKGPIPIASSITPNSSA
jgi:DNA-binding transcriptional regulator YiaG